VHQPEVLAALSKCHEVFMPFGAPVSLPAGHFGTGHGSRAHAPDEYYVIESSNPAVEGMAGATLADVKYLNALATL
jgi:hypothetical protein